MVVWIREGAGADPPVTTLSLAALAEPTASHCHSADAVQAMNDGILPKNSIDHGIPRFTWWNHKGGEEWVALEFDEKKKFSQCEVYWFDDTGKGACRVPKSWQLSWKDGEKWKKGHWRPEKEKGREWKPGRYDERGRWAPGHWDDRGGDYRNDHRDGRGGDRWEDRGGGRRDDYRDGRGGDRWDDRGGRR